MERMGKEYRMDTVTVLQPGQVLRLRDAVGHRITGLRGEIWITQENDRRDVILTPGEGFVLDRPGLALAQAVGDVALLAEEAP
jgi:hypothetical protein